MERRYNGKGTGRRLVSLLLCLVMAAQLLPVTAAAEETAALVKERMSEIRRLGFSAGINVLATIGHHPQYPDKCLHSHYRHMTNKNGEKTSDWSNKDEMLYLKCTKTERDTYKK